MGRKKRMEPEIDFVSTQPDIFKTLFANANANANANADAAAPSIFSENNPFRRKNLEPGLGYSPSAEEAENINHGASENNGDGVEVKKRKKNKEKGVSGVFKEEDSETHLEPLEGKKSKKKKLQQTPNLENPNLGSELNEASKLGESPNMSVVKKMDVKKRKRDELESVYEAKKYGVKESEEDGDKHVGTKLIGEKRKTVDNPADMLVSNEGFDDESKLLRTVFVGNLPLKIKKKVLIREFSKFGEVESVRIRSVPIIDTKRPRKGAILTNQIHDKVGSVNAYIVFKAEESAQASLSHNMSVVEGHHIRVDRACPPRKKLKGESVIAYDHMRTVFVGNLPFDVKDEEVYQLFCGNNSLESNIEAIRIIRDPHYGIGKGIGYVLFKTREAANMVIRRRNLKLGDREIRVFHAKPNFMPSERKSLSSQSKPDSRTPHFNKVNSKSSMPYQGLRAGKPGVEKKYHEKFSRPDKFESRSLSGVKRKVRSDKRPAVAARKGKATFQSGGGAAKQIGVKRKMDSRTPQSSQQKKARKYSR